MLLRESLLEGLGHSEQVEVLEPTRTKQLNHCLQVDRLSLSLCHEGLEVIRTRKGYRLVLSCPLLRIINQVSYSRDHAAQKLSHVLLVVN